MMAASHNRLEVISLLLSHNADVNMQIESGTSALMMVGDSKKAVELLLERGAMIELKDTKGRTALFYVIDSNEPVKLELLLNKGARTDLKDRSGVTICDLAKAIKDPKRKESTVRILQKFSACLTRDKHR